MKIETPREVKLKPFFPPQRCLLACQIISLEGKSLLWYNPLHNTEVTPSPYYIMLRELGYGETTNNTDLAGFLLWVIVSNPEILCLFISIYHLCKIIFKSGYLLGSEGGLDLSQSTLRKDSYPSGMRNSLTCPEVAKSFSRYNINVSSNLIEVSLAQMLKSCTYIT